MSPPPSAEISRLLEELRRLYPYAQAPLVGPGRRPAVLVIDYIEGFTNPSSPFSGDWTTPIEHTVALLEAARKANRDCIFTTVEYEQAELASNLLITKAPRVAALTRGSVWTLVDHRLARGPNDLVIAKRHGSAFFGTALASHLQMTGIDTLVIAGCVTSGCVRATVVDAAQYGFRPLVVREAVGDRSVLANETNLMDIQARYGDVISCDDAIRYLADTSVIHA